MFDVIKNALNVREDDVLAISLHLSRFEDKCDDDPVSITLGLSFLDENDVEWPLAEVTGTMYNGMDTDYCLTDYAKWMGDHHMDHGIAGDLACQYYKENYSDPYGFYPDSVLYIRNIELKTMNANPDARGRILKNIGYLYRHCSGMRPDVVTMIFDHSENDIKECFSDDYLISSEGDTCFVDCEGSL